MWATFSLLKNTVISTYHVFGKALIKALYSPFHKIMLPLLMPDFLFRIILFYCYLTNNVI